MATSRHPKRRTLPEPSNHREGLRKIGKGRGGEACCPICEVTLWPGTVEQHYQQEFARLNTSAPSLVHSKKKRRASASVKEGNSSRSETTLSVRARQVLESVRRRHILFNSSTHPSTECPGSSSSVDPSARTCPVCACTLSSEEGMAEAHVDACLGGGGAGPGSVGGDSSDSEEYEEYTWCNVTRVRATSMLSPQARANMFDGTLISKGESSQANEMVDVEEDETAVYGPPQYNEQDVLLSVQPDVEEGSEVSAGGGVEGGVLDNTGQTGKEVKSKPEQRDRQQCLICIDSYQNPLVSIKCWHVYCEKCWLKALGSKKLCPKCKDITSPSDLRKIYL